MMEAKLWIVFLFTFICCSYGGDEASEDIAYIQEKLALLIESDTTPSREQLVSLQQRLDNVIKSKIESSSLFKIQSTLKTMISSGRQPSAGHLAFLKNKLDQVVKAGKQSQNEKLNIMREELYRYGESGIPPTLEEMEGFLEQLDDVIGAEKQASKLNCIKGKLDELIESGRSPTKEELVILKEKVDCALNSNEDSVEKELAAIKEKVDRIEQSGKEINKEQLESIQEDLINLAKAGIQPTKEQLSHLKDKIKALDYSNKLPEDISPKDLKKKQEGYKHNPFNYDKPQASELREAKCVFSKSTGSKDFEVDGEVVLVQREGSDTVFVHGFVQGFQADGIPKFRGFHIHENGNLGNECNNTGKHFNPTNLRHGAPTDAERHIGDLGNIKDLGNSLAYVIIYDHKISLFGPNNVVGRSIVVDELADDLGIRRDVDEISATYGSLGKRVTCCTIEWAEVGHLALYFSTRVEPPTLIGQYN